MGFKGLQIFWPPIFDVVTAKKAAKQGFVAAVFISGATTLLLMYRIVSTRSYDTTEVFNSILGNIVPMALIAFFISRMSRIASISALVLSCGEMLYKITVYNTAGIYPLFIIFFINSIRGTFIYHRLLKNMPQTTANTA
jgi:hypothetical protein